MKNTATNFSYFLPRHIFNSCETQELYPGAIRPSDPELKGEGGIDKAMTMLNIAEDQIFKFQHAEPFNPADFGFTEQQVGGETEFDTGALYISPDHKYWVSPSGKAMTWEITKLKLTEGEEKLDMMGNLERDWEITAFIPNKVTGAIILQSLGVIDLVNPEGVYAIPDQPQEIVEPVQVPGDDKPVIVFAPRTFNDPADLDTFLIENGVLNENKEQVRRAMFMVPEALNAMRQVRFLIQERNSGHVSFDLVPEAIEAHPNLSPEQKAKMIGEWNAAPEEGNDQNPAAEAPVTETAPTE